MNFAEILTMHRVLGLVAAAFLVMLVQPIEAQSKTEKEAAVLKYQGKLLIAKKDGIAVGPFVKGGTRLEPPTPGAVNTINDAGVTQEDPGTFPSTALVRKGEVLKITAVRLINVPKASHSYEKGGYLVLAVDTLSPHAVTRGIGAFAHESM